MTKNNTQFTVTWHDSGREPQCPPNSRYPTGIDIVCEDTTEFNSCRVELPYPAKRCGYYHIRCNICGITVAITTAGRPDDPRSARFPCAKRPTN